MPESRRHTIAVSLLVLGLACSGIWCLSSSSELGHPSEPLEDPKGAPPPIRQRADQPNRAALANPPPQKGRGGVVIELLGHLQHEPVADCAVRVTADRDSRTVEERSTEAGSVAFLDLKPGWYRVEARAVERRVAIVAEKTIRITMVLGVTVGIRGQVLDDSGRPAADAEVYAQLRDRRRTPLTRTDDGGFFVVRGLTPATWIGAHRPGEGHAGARRVFDHIRGNVQTAEFVLRLGPPSHRLRVHVVSGGGERIADSAVTLRMRSEFLRTGSGVTRIAEFTSKSTGAGGWADFEVIPTRTYVVSADGTPDHARQQKELHVTDSTREVVLSLAKGSILSGVVVDDENHPVADCLVSAGTPSEGLYACSTRTSADGGFQLRGLPVASFVYNDQGDYGRGVMLSAVHPSLGRAKRFVTLGPGSSGRASLELIRAGLVRGSIVWESDTAPSSWRVTFTSDGSTRVAAQVGPSEFLGTILPNGESAEIRLYPGASMIAVAAVKDVTSGPVKIHAPRTEWTRIRGSAPLDSTVTFLSSEFGSSYHVITDARGRYETIRLPVVKYGVRLDRKNDSQTRMARSGYTPPAYSAILNLHGLLPSPSACKLTMLVADLDSTHRWTLRLLSGETLLLETRVRSRSRLTKSVEPGQYVVTLSRDGESVPQVTRKLQVKRDVTIHIPN
jgi:hypothetical protein